MTTHRFFFTTIAILLAVAALAWAGEPLQRAQVITLDGVTGRIDHMAADVKAGRLYVAALGNNTVEVIDLAAGKRLRSIADCAEPQGVCVLPDGTLVVASGTDGCVRFYANGETLLAALTDLDDADNVRYDATGKLAYVGYGDGALAVIDPAQRKKVAALALPGHPESFQLETRGQRIFVNVPGARQVVVIDRDKREIIGNWPVTAAASNFPMALDEERHHLLIGCRKPAKLLVFDTTTGEMISAMDCCGDADDIFCDAVTHRVYISGGAGLITMLKQAPVDAAAINPYTIEATITTAPGARTALWSPDLGKYFIAAPQRGNQPAQLFIYTPESR